MSITADLDAARVLANEPKPRFCRAETSGAQRLCQTRDLAGRSL